MKLHKLVFFIYLLGLTSVSQGVSLSEYLATHYTISFVEKLPSHTQNNMMIISNRYFKPDENYILKRGLHLRYKTFLFLAGTRGDSAFLVPIKSMDETSDSLFLHRDFLVYVDGHGKTFDQVVERGFELTGRFRINMVLFDWPTDYLALRKTAYNAYEVAPNFVIAMNQFSQWHKKYYPYTSVSAVFHSMGNRVLESITSKNLLKYMPDDLFTNLILNAAAVKRGNHKVWLEKLAIQKRIYITINQNDRTLYGAKLLRLSNQLGLGNKHKTADNAKYVDFTQVASNEHNLFLEKSEAGKNNGFIYSFYDQAFHGKEVDFGNETAYQILSPSEISFRFSLK